MPATSHPTPAELQAFVLGTLPDLAASGVEAHLSGCPACQQAAAAATDDTLVSLLRSAETSQAGPVTPGTAFNETVSLSRAGADIDPADRPTGLADHAKYRLIRPLGRGGMGHVWLAEHTVMGRPVALKLVRPEFLDRPEAVERFRREVRAAARLCHPNIVAAHDAEEAGGTHFLVMEYIDGETLAERIDAGPVTVEDACRWTIDSARGLEHARSQGLIHRDVKPHNLIRERATGRVKVLDFGLAGMIAGEASGLTGGNVVIGTPDYIAPEQAMDARKADTRSDVYSLGCTLYHLLAGRPPFGGDSVLAKIDAHRHDQPEALAAVRRDMTPALAELVARMMAKDPSQRPQTPGEVAVALEHLLAGGGGDEPPAPARRRDDGDGERGRRRLLAGLAWVAVVVFGVVIGGLAVRWARDDGRADGDGVLTVESGIPAEVIVMKNGQVVRSIRAPDSVHLPRGTYEMGVRTGGIRLDAQVVDIRGGRPVVVRVERLPEQLVSMSGLRPLGPADPAEVGWTDQLAPVNLLRDSEVGRVTRDEAGPKAALVLASTSEMNARVRLPFRPTGSYEVRATIARTGGDDAFVLVLPLPGGPGDDPLVTLAVDMPILGEGRTFLGTINGEHIRTAMPEAFGGRLEREKPYRLYVRVFVAGDKVGIRAELDGKVLMDWSGQATEFTGGPAWTAADNSRLAVGVLRGAYRVEQLDARPLPGSGPGTAPAPFLLHGRPDGPFTELIAYVDPSLDREAGSLGSHSQASLTVSSDKAGPARVALQVRPEGDYEFRARIVRLAGDGSFNLMLPVPGTEGKVQIGVLLDTVRDRRGFVVLDWPDGPDSPLEKTLNGRLKPGQQYLVLARVSKLGDRVQVMVSVNGVPIIEWTGLTTEDRNGRSAFTRDRRQLGFGASGGEFRVDRLEFRVLNGTANLSRRPAPEPAAPSGPGIWVDLLRDLKLPPAIVAGTWGWSGGVGDTALIGGASKEGKAGRLALSVVPRSNYELRIRFQRVTGDDGLVVLLRIPGTNRVQTPLIVDGHPDQGGLVGLESVKEKPVTRPVRDAVGGRLKNKTTYTLLVAVASHASTATVRAEIDNTPAFAWTGPIGDLTPHPSWFTLGRNEIGLGVPDGSQFRIESLELRRAAGSD